MDKLQAIGIFVRVAELQSFTKAAESLGMAKATVSTVVGQLETLLDTRLFNRTTRRVQLTTDGISFYERSRDLLVDVDDLESMFQKDAKNVSGKLRVDMPQGFARNLLIPNLGTFLDIYPHLEIEISSTDRRVDLIREGFDCVLRVGTLPDSGLIAKKLGDLEIINCVSPAYTKRYGVPKRLDDLKKHFLIHYVPNLGAKSEGFEYVEKDKVKNIKMKGAVTVNNTDAYLAASLSGLGIIQVPTFGVKNYLKEKKLVEVLPKYRAEPMPVYLVYPHRRHISKRVKLFMDWVQEMIGEYVG